MQIDKANFSKVDFEQTKSQFLAFQSSSLQNPYLLTGWTS
jgi:hypothetical protein